MKKWLKDLFDGIINIFRHYGLFSLFLIPIFFLLNLSYAVVTNAEKTSLETQYLSIAKEKVNVIDFIISSAVVQTSLDMFVIADADETQTFWLNQDPSNLHAFEQLLYRFSSNKPQFADVEVLDLEGDQIAWLDRQSGEMKIVEPENLVNRADKDFFDVAQSLEKNDIYILPLYLSVEIIDEIEVIKPMVSFVIAMYDSHNTKQGYLMVDYNGVFLLNIFNSYVVEDNKHIELGIVNQNTTWEITSGFKKYIKNDQTFQESTDTYINSQEIEVYFKSISLNQDFIGNIINEDEEFVIFSFIDYAGVYHELGGLLLRVPFFGYFLNVIVLIAVFYLAKVFKTRSDNRILLNANMYLSDKNNDGVLITDEKSHINYANKAFEDIYGYKQEEIVGKNPNEILGISTYVIKGTILRNSEMISKHIWNISRKEILILKFLRIKPETTSSGLVKHFLGIYSKPQIEMEELAYAFNYDSIESFKLFAKAFEDVDLKANRTCFAAIRISNEKTKQMFDSKTKTNLSPYAFAEFLRLNLNKKFKIAVPYDQYVIVHVSLDQTEQNFEEFIEHLHFLIEKYKQQPNINSFLEYKIGVALANNLTSTKADLIENAFIALQMSKSQKNVKHIVYTDEIKKIIKRERDIYNQLEQGFNFDEFYLQYQVQKNCRTDTYIGVEALLRWNNSVLGNISPLSFIPIIENSFYINRLSTIVMKKIIKDFSPYIEHLREDFRIAINLTSFDFFSEQIIRSLVEMIERSSLKTKNFTFEITESGYLENKDKTNSIIKYLHSKNIIVAIDDFGTGFSSLEVLKNINIDKLKIARTFIKDYPEKDNGEIFKTMVNIGKAMQLEILLEGAETKEQVDFALANGCDEVQGYYVSQPIYIENFVRKYLNKKSDF